MTPIISNILAIIVTSSSQYSQINNKHYNSEY
jgi:hypothetical protein